MGILQSKGFTGEASRGTLTLGLCQEAACKGRANAY
jgi:hypothetical protein